MKSTDVDDAVALFVEVTKRSGILAKILSVSDDDLTCMGYEMFQPSCFNTSVVARDRSVNGKLVGYLAFADWFDLFSDQSDFAEYKRLHPRKKPMSDGEKKLHHVLELLENDIKRQMKFEFKHGECLYGMVVGVSSGYHLLKELSRQQFPLRKNYEYSFGIATHSKTLAQSSGRDEVVHQSTLCWNDIISLDPRFSQAKEKSGVDGILARLWRQKSFSSANQQSKSKL